MKICFLAAADSAHSYRWIRFFAERGHEVHWISLVPADRDLPSGVRFYRVGGSLPGQFQLLTAAPKVRGLVRRISPDVLHAHYAGAYGLLGMLTGVRPLVVTAWGSDVLFAGRGRFTGPIVRRVLASADLITCDAYHMVEAMRRLGTDTSRIRVVFFGVETDRFRPGEADRQYLSEWDAGERRVVISLRSLEPVYDIGTLIDAAPDIVAAYPDVRIVVAGSGSNRPTLESQVRSLRLQDSVVFTGRYEHANLPRMLRTAQVYVSTSLSDAGIAASTAEAMSSGLPVVITDTGENREWVTEGETGFIVPPRDPRALAQRVIRLLEDASLRAAMGSRARETIVARNDYVREMQKVDDLYVELAGPRAGRERA
jgi:glycosyltransferase involved in cell wall biosynthesis